MGILRVLWDGHLARPDWAGKMPTPQLVRGFNGKVAHCAKEDSLAFEIVAAERSHRILSYYVPSSKPQTPA